MRLSVGGALGGVTRSLSAFGVRLSVCSLDSLTFALNGIRSLSR